MSCLADRHNTSDMADESRQVQHPQGGLAKRDSTVPLSPGLGPNP